MPPKIKPRKPSSTAQGSVTRRGRCGSVSLHQPTSKSTITIGSAKAKAIPSPNPRKGNGMNGDIGQDIGQWWPVATLIEEIIPVALAMAEPTRLDRNAAMKNVPILAPRPASGSKPSHHLRRALMITREAMPTMTATTAVVWSTILPSP